MTKCCLCNNGGSCRNCKCSKSRRKLNVPTVVQPILDNRCLNQIAHNTITNGRQNPQYGTSTTFSATRTLDTAAQTMGEKNCSPSPRNLDASVQLCNTTSSASSNVPSQLLYSQVLQQQTSNSLNQRLQTPARQQQLQSSSLPTGTLHHGNTLHQTPQPKSAQKPLGQTITMDQSPSTATVTIEAMDTDVTYENPISTQMSPPNFRWGTLIQVNSLDINRSRLFGVVHWRKNLFFIPAGDSGKQFVNELAKLAQAYADRSTLECVAITAMMLIPHILLQRLPRKCSHRELSQCLSRRLEAWKEGKIDELMHERRTLQQHLHTPSKQPKQSSCTDLSQGFAEFMKRGNVVAAERLITAESKTGLLSLDDHIPGLTEKTVRDVLRKKHPNPSRGYPNAMRDASAQKPAAHAIIFDAIDGLLIRKMALKSTGPAGPSGLDASAWKHLCTSFQKSYKNLCNALASVARRISTEFLDPSSTFALFACRIVSLDKRPAVRPIGVCETLRRIIGKAALYQQSKVMFYP